MFHLRYLSKLHVNSKLLALSYNSMISSVLTYVISSWYNACNINQRNALKRFRKKCCKLVRKTEHQLIFTIESVYLKSTLLSVKKIMSDPCHPIHVYFRLLPHGNRLNMPHCRTNRHKSTFVPSSVKLYNS